MEIKRVVAGVYAANCYLVYDGDKGFIIDPGGHPDKIIKEIDELGFTPEFILLTHGHCDHIAGVEKLRDHYKIKAYIHEDDKEMVADRDLSLAAMMPSADVAFDIDGTFKEKEVISPGYFDIEVIHTPGHTAGCSCFKVGKDLFTGDTLFAGSIGRTDLPTASDKDMKESLEYLKGLDNDLIVHPGHGAETTMGREKETNQFLM